MMANRKDDLIEIEKEEIMKKSWIFSVMTIVVIGMVPALAITDPPESLVVDKTECVIFDSFYDKAVVNDIPHVVETLSSNQNVNATCHVNLLVVPDHAIVIHSREFPTIFCKIATVTYGIVFTDDWHEVITPSGNVTLTCHFKGEAPEIPQ